ncbi:MAG: universal stress protein [Chloroflexota bacterium]
MNRELRMLLHSDGSEISSHALALGKRIARAMAEEVDILAMGDTPKQEQVSRREVQETASEFQACGIPVTVHERCGATRQGVVQQADAADYGLIVIGSRGRRGIRRLLAGSRARAVLGGTATSVLIVKKPERSEIDHILVCSAAGPASEETVRFAGRLAHALDASVTLLHVMSQVALEETAKGADLEAGADELMKREAREGAHLKEMLRILRDEDLDAEVIVRHGLVVEEVLAEAQAQNYGLVIIGAHVTPDIKSLVSSDLAEQIMLAATRPVLIVRQG